MVCTANELSKLENFPKGLRVLLLDEDINSSVETKSKLESMDYLVSIFSNEDEALLAISKKPESFHVAIVEVSTSCKNGSFKFLEAAKDLPTIMTSNVHCLNTMMKCIALGAVEFLHKPLSEDKLGNIWQHVVRKAFNAGGSTGSKSLKPVKESVVSMLHRPSETAQTNSTIWEEQESIVEEEKDPAPSTPQLKQGARLLDDADCQENENCSTENANCSIEKESGNHDIRESKSVDTTNCVTEANKDVQETGDPTVVIKEEEKEDGDLKSDNTASLCGETRQNKDDLKDSCRSNRPNNKFSGIKNVFGVKSYRKKVDWTPELHKKFVQAVEQLGVDQAIPSRILELMKVEGLTRHNVASHLQKYRMHRRNILPKEDEQRWIRPRDHQMQRSCYHHRPIMAYPPPFQSHPMNMVGSPCPVWGLPGGVHHPNTHMWGPAGYSPWQPMENWRWEPYPGMNANTWGCPVVTPSNGPYHSSPQNASGFHCSKMPQPYATTLHPDDEAIDKVVKEAINKPWLPLPLGLKPPSTDGVLAELSRKGISTVPSINGPWLC